jgi:hypothetical protein
MSRGVRSLVWLLRLAFELGAEFYQERRRKRRAARAARIAKDRKTLERIK